MLIASDLHGSTACIKKLWKRYDEEKSDRIILLGDLLYHGARNDLPEEYNTKEAIDLLNSKSDIITCVRGNCDSEVDAMVLDFMVEAPHMILSDSGLNIFITHGHHYNTGHLPPMNNIDIKLWYGWLTIKAISTTCHQEAYDYAEELLNLLNKKI